MADTKATTKATKTTKPGTAADSDNLQDQAIADLDPKEKARIDSLSYEQARDELIEAVQKLENGNLDLDSSMRQWEIGEALARRAQSLLDEVRSKLNAVKEQQAQEGSTAGTQANLDSNR